MRRNLPISIILTIVTLGIYGLYWFVVLTDEINELSGRKNDTSGGMCLIFTIITFGIYGIYWAYKMGEKMSFIKEMYYGTRSSDTILYAIIYLVGLPIIVYALVQYELNSIIDGNNSYSSFANSSQYMGNNQYVNNGQYNNNQYANNDQYNNNQYANNDQYNNNQYANNDQYNNNQYVNNNNSNNNQYDYSAQNNNEFGNLYQEGTDDKNFENEDYGDE